MSDAEKIETPGDEPAVEWLSQSECARRLNDAGDPVTQQKLSVYLERYPDLPRRDGGPRGAMLVDFAALRAHRQQNIRVQERAAHADRDPAPAIDTAGDLRLRERRAATEKAEFELARARGELVPRAAVERAIRAAGVELDVVLKSTRLERAEKLESTRDARAKAALLVQQDDAVREKFAAALMLAAAGAIGEEFAADDGEGGENFADASAAAEIAGDVSEISSEQPAQSPAAAM